MRQLFSTSENSRLRTAYSQQYYVQERLYVCMCIIHHTHMYTCVRLFKLAILIQYNLYVLFYHHMYMCIYVHTYVCGGKGVYGGCKYVCLCVQLSCDNFISLHLRMYVRTYTVNILVIVGS